jgi:hypothetical protein
LVIRSILLTNLSELGSELDTLMQWCPALET